MAVRQCRQAELPDLGRRLRMGFRQTAGFDRLSLRPGRPPASGRAGRSPFAQFNPRAARATRPALHSEAQRRFRPHLGSQHRRRERALADGRRQFAVLVSSGGGLHALLRPHDGCALDHRLHLSERHIARQIFPAAVGRHDDALGRYVRQRGTNARGDGLRRLNRTDTRPLR